MRSPQILLAFVLFCQAVMAQVPPSSSSAVASDLATIRQRFVQSVLPHDPDQIKHLEALAEQYRTTLQPNGRWADIDYTNQDRANWKLRGHLDRALVMAEAARLKQQAGHPDSALENAVIEAIREWTERDYQNPNWWWNQIGVPQMLGETALVIPRLPQEQVDRITAIMQRSNWSRWTGANLTWGVTNEIVRGCLQGDFAAVAEGYQRMYQEIEIVAPGKEGIQPDYSFHQHGSQLYNGGYGLDFANDVGRFIAFSWGTRYQIPADRMAIFSSFLLDGEQWMVRGDVIDYSVVGREIVRPGKVIADRDWTRGPISPTGAAYGLPSVVAMLAALDTPRRQELRAFAQALRGDANAYGPAGNKQFWCSDFMTHRRNGFYTSVKMLSTRMQNAELVNSEGRNSVHLSDGVNLLYLSGDEYKDIFPAWDWTKLPGTTAIQGTLNTGERNPISVHGTTSFDGGVSDGQYGMAAMDLQRGDLTAKKAWFFFDDGYLCLGAGITLTGNTKLDVATDVNQPLLHGQVFTSASPEPIPEGTYHYHPARTFWAYHDHVGYLIAPGNNINLSLGNQTGRWSDIGAGSNAPVTVPVFNLWIDHGSLPHGGTYQYMVLPGASVAEMNQQTRKPELQVLSNTAAIQAAWNPRIRLAMIAFRTPGALKTPLGAVSVDHSCLLLVKKTPDGWKITASNPENVGLLLHVAINKHRVDINLPGGNLAGSSVAASLSMAD